MAERVDVVVLGMGVGGEVGATTMGPRGGDILGIFELAIKLQIPSDGLRHLIYAYPTFYRGAGEAVRKLGPDMHTPMH